MARADLVGKPYLKMGVDKNGYSLVTFTPAQWPTNPAAWEAARHASSTGHSFQATGNATAELAVLQPLQMRANRAEASRIDGLPDDYVITINPQWGPSLWERFKRWIARGGSAD